MSNEILNPQNERKRHLIERGLSRKTQLVADLKVIDPKWKEIIFKIGTLYNSIFNS